MDTRALDRLCAAFRRQIRSRLLQAGACRLAILALTLLPGFLALDWWVHLTSPWRLVILVGYLAALGAVGWWTMLAPMSRRWGNEEVLAYIDSALPAGRGMLLDLYQLIQGRNIQELSTPLGQEMVEAARQDLAPLVEEAERCQTLHRRRLMRWAQVAGVVVVLFLTAAVALDAFLDEKYVRIGLERFFNPFSSQRWPSRTTIALEEPANGWTIPQMESFTVRGKVTGLIPPQAVMAYRVKSAGYWIKEKIPVRDDGALVYTFPQVREPIDFEIRGGDYVTDQHRIEIVERPYLKKILAYYSYPDYAGIPDRTVPSGQLAGLEGTSVRLAFECSMALKKAVLTLDLKTGKQSEELPLASETKFEKTLVLSADGSYTVELYEKHGFRESKPERYEIRVTPDNPPEAELLAPGRDLVVVRDASVDVALRARDDFGLKKVEFLYQVDEGKPVALTDRITGPLEPKGKAKDAFFKWDLRKMTTLPKTATLKYFVRATDVNPTGRGVTETNKYQIKLVKRSEKHFQLFETAKRIDMEARVAWESQYTAWERGKEWLEKGTGAENDPVWQDLRDKQDLAIRASKAMETYLRDLIQEYEQNDMRSEFMAGRLGVITDLLRRVTDKEHPAISTGLERTRPKTDADAAPERQKQLRGAALKEFTNNQKLATLFLERILKRVFDWRDLQTTLIRTTLLHEEQEEVLAATTALGPKTLGWRIEDLADDVQDKLLTLGKRQGTIFDVESELEKELEFQMYRAEKQKRGSILVPMLTAYRGLRDKRVNDNLKQATSSIQSNQLLPIVKNQKDALEALSLVKAGLVFAGQKIDPEDAEKTITLALVPAKIIDVQPKTETQPGETPTEDTSVVASLPQEVLKANLNLGGDPLTAAISAAWEAQDQVRSRTKYLAENSSAAEMPRFVRHKQGILLEKQSDALGAVERAVGEAEKANAPFVREQLESVKGEFTQSRGLIGGRHLAGNVQQFQADSMDSLDDLRRLALPIEKAVKEVADENKGRGGLDQFNRQYLVRDKDLDGLAAVIGDLNRAQVLEREAARKVSRFAKFKPEAPPVAEVEKSQRARAAEAQRKTATLVAGVAPRVSTLSEEVGPRVRAAGTEAVVALKLAAMADDIAAGSKDKETSAALAEVATLLEQTIMNLRNLLEERVRPPVVVKEPGVGEEPKITMQEWERLHSPEFLREKLKEDKRIPPEVRDIMLRALSKEFPPKYKEMLAAYYASFLSEEAKKEPGEKKKENGKPEGDRKEGKQP
jgi:hypothetical protein